METQQAGEQAEACNAVARSGNPILLREVCRVSADRGGHASPTLQHSLTRILYQKDLSINRPRARCLLVHDTAFARTHSVISPGLYIHVHLSLPRPTNIRQSQFTFLWHPASDSASTLEVLVAVITHQRSAHRSYVSSKVKKYTRTFRGPSFILVMTVNATYLFQFATIMPTRTSKPSNQTNSTFI